MKSVLYVTYKQQDYFLMEANKNLLLQKTPIPYIPTSTAVNGHGINAFLQQYSNYTTLERFLGQMKKKEHFTVGNFAFTFNSHVMKTNSKMASNNFKVPYLDYIVLSVAIVIILHYMLVKPIQEWYDESVVKA